VELSVIRTTVTVLTLTLLLPTLQTLLTLILGTVVNIAPQTQMLSWKDFTIGTLHYNWPMSAHVSHAFIASSVPIV